MKSNARAVYVAIPVLFIGVAGGWLISNARSSGTQPPAPFVQVRANLVQYTYINPLLYSDNARDDSVRFDSFRESLGKSIFADEQSGKASSASVYFRDLNTARWTGVDEDEPYRPSSMLKVVNMMAALQVAERQPGFLSKQLYYKATDHSDQYYRPQDSLAAGYHSVQELINAMIINSDNDALDALQSDADVKNGFGSIYSLFRLPTASATSTDFMSPKSYAVLFRSLYNSSLFRWDLSEQVLDLLVHTGFSKGLVAGVPSGILVAHKFGENTGTTPDGAVVSRELHDCGIVYYPAHPYLLCVMTRGREFSELESVIAEISKQAYSFVGSDIAK